MTPLTLREKVRGLLKDGASTLFTDDEIDEFVQDGTSWYSRYKPRRIPFTLNLVAGQSQYTLPSDWIRVDKASFNKCINPSSNVDLTQFTSFVLPTLNNNALLQETSFDWYDSELYVIVSPTPQSTQSLSFSYYAMHQLTNDLFTIPQPDIIALSYISASFALNALAVDKGSKMQKYKVGQGLQIDDTEVAKRVQEQAEKYEHMFNKFIRFRPIGGMS
jgi:hypothetical protein